MALQTLSMKSESILIDRSRMDEASLHNSMSQKTVDSHCTLCNVPLIKHSLNKKKKLHVCKYCQKPICCDCKGGKIYLPGYYKEKCVCKQCWSRLIPSYVIQNTIDSPKLDRRSINSIVYTVAQFLYSNNFHYPYIFIKDHIIHGEQIYNNILRDIPIHNKKDISDLYWYFFGRAAGKNSSFLSGMIFVEDKDFKVFKALAHFGYPRCLPLHALGTFMQFPVQWTLGSTHLAAYIEYCQVNTPWSLSETKVPIYMEKGRIGHGYDQVGIDLMTLSEENQTLNINAPFLPFAKGHILMGKIPLKHPSMNDYIFLKMETYGTGCPSDLLMHTFRFGMYLSKDKHTVNTRREEINMSIYKDFCSLLRSISDVLLKHVIKMDIKSCMERARIKGISTIFTICKDILITINSAITKSISIEYFNLLFPLYDHVYKFMYTNILLPSTCDHITIRFGNEVILDEQELQSSHYIRKPQTSVLDPLPCIARPRGYSINTIKKRSTSLYQKAVSSIVDTQSLPLYSRDMLYPNAFSIPSPSQLRGRHTPSPTQCISTTTTTTTTITTTTNDYTDTYIPYESEKNKNMNNNSTMSDTLHKTPSYNSIDSSLYTQMNSTYIKNLNQSNIHTNIYTDTNLTTNTTSSIPNHSNKVNNNNNDNTLYPLIERPPSLSPSLSLSMSPSPSPSVYTSSSIPISCSTNKQEYTIRHYTSNICFNSTDSETNIISTPNPINKK